MPSPMAFQVNGKAGKPRVLIGELVNLRAKILSRQLCALVTTGGWGYPSIEQHRRFDVDEYMAEAEDGGSDDDDDDEEEKEEKEDKEDKRIRRIRRIRRISWIRRIRRIRGKRKSKKKRRRKRKRKRRMGSMRMMRMRMSRTSRRSRCSGLLPSHKPQQLQRLKMRKILQLQTHN